MTLETPNSFEAVNAVLENDIEKINHLVLNEGLNLANAVKFASSLGKFEILKILLESRGYEPDTKEIMDALIESAKNNRKDCVEFIMDNYASVNITKALEVSTPECAEIISSKHDPFCYSKQKFFKY